MDHGRLLKVEWRAIPLKSNGSISSSPQAAQGRDVGDCPPYPVMSMSASRPGCGPRISLSPPQLQRQFVRDAGLSSVFCFRVNKRHYSRRVLSNVRVEHSPTRGGPSAACQEGSS
jgi:hypothetical protein